MSSFISMGDFHFYLGGDQDTMFIIVCALLIKALIFLLFWGYWMHMKVGFLEKNLDEWRIRFLIPLFHGKMNFLVRKSYVEELLIQQDINKAFEKTKPISLENMNWRGRWAIFDWPLHLIISITIWRRQTSECCWRSFKRCMLWSLLQTNFT